MTIDMKFTAPKVDTMFDSNMYTTSHHYVLPTTLSSAFKSFALGVFTSLRQNIIQFEQNQNSESCSHSQVYDHSNKLWEAKVHPVASLTMPTRNGLINTHFDGRLKEQHVLLVKCINKFVNQHALVVFS
jgi:hypothetical protein